MCCLNRGVHSLHSALDVLGSKVALSRRGRGFPCQGAMMPAAPLTPQALNNPFRSCDSFGSGGGAIGGGLRRGLGLRLAAVSSRRGQWVSGLARGSQPPWQPAALTAQTCRRLSCACPRAGRQVVRGPPCWGHVQQGVRLWRPVNSAAACLASSCIIAWHSPFCAF